MVIPDTFGTRGVRYLINYNYTDIQTGTGFIKYYLGKTIDKNLLSGNVYYSNSKNTDDAPSSTSYVKEIDLDFDIEFKIPQTIKGTAIINIPIGIQTNYTTGTCYAYSIARIRKWDGSSEIEIGLNQGAEISASGNGTTHANMDALDVTIPQTHFKIGETLRITIEVWMKYVTNDGTGTLGHDPIGRTVSGLLNQGEYGDEQVSSVMTALIPFKLDL